MTGFAGAAIHRPRRRTLAQLSACVPRGFNGPDSALELISRFADLPRPAPGQADLGALLCRDSRASNCTAGEAGFDKNRTDALRPGAVDAGSLVLNAVPAVIPLAERRGHGWCSRADGTGDRMHATNTHTSLPGLALGQVLHDSFRHPELEAGRRSRYARTDRSLWMRDRLSGPVSRQLARPGLTGCPVGLPRPALVLQIIRPGPGATAVDHRRQ